MAINKILFEVDEDNFEEYYSVDGFGFEEGDVYGTFVQITQEIDLTLICRFLADRWPIIYGKAVNLMIKEGYEPEGISIDKEKLMVLYNEDLFVALCKYTLNSLSYFSDQFIGGTPETDIMLNEVTDFINQS